MFIFKSNNVKSNIYLIQWFVHVRLDCRYLLTIGIILRLRLYMSFGKQKYLHACLTNINIDSLWTCFTVFYEEQAYTLAHRLACCSPGLLHVQLVKPYVNKPPYQCWHSEGQHDNHPGRRVLNINPIDIWQSIHVPTEWRTCHPTPML